MKVSTLEEVASPKRRLQLTGRRFGRLRVVGRASPVGSQPVYWRCVCTCGAEKDVAADSLVRGNTLSCGCLRRQMTTVRFTEHGQARHGNRTPTYESYMAARTRCNDPKHSDYRLYGGRGIQFLFTSFEQFVAEVGPRPRGKTIDRINTNGHYEPGNVKWSTASEQQRNKRPYHHGPKGTAL